MSSSSGVSPQISNRAAYILYGIAMLGASFVCFYYPKQIAKAFPSHFRHSNVWVYLCGIALLLAGLAIFLDLLVTKYAGYLLAILLFCMAVAIDLRGIFNAKDPEKYIYAYGLAKDVGLIAGAIIIANLVRERESHRSHRRRSASNKSSGATTTS